MIKCIGLLINLVLSLGKQQSKVRIWLIWVLLLQWEGFAGL